MLFCGTPVKCSAVSVHAMWRYHGRNMPGIDTADVRARQLYTARCHKLRCRVVCAAQQPQALRKYGRAVMVHPPRFSIDILLQTIQLLTVAG